MRNENEKGKWERKVRKENGKRNEIGKWERKMGKNEESEGWKSRKMNRILSYYL